MSIMLFYRYWELKKEMADGSEPDNLSALREQLQPFCCGYSLCGAGAGGYAAFILRREFTASDVAEKEWKVDDQVSELRVSRIEVDNDGIEMNVHKLSRQDAFFEDGRMENSVDDEYFLRIFQEHIVI